jgi:oligoribonuclease (3'-5' exoribonuclease)|tara:strand:+ start:576 stop:788 length:213 start_codon:yes stop_codon:yes gene_type:complete
MKEKPYRVTMTYLKNVAKRHRPAIYEEQSKDETFWGLNENDVMRKCHARYGYQVTVKSAAILPGWADVTF